MTREEIRERLDDLVEWGDAENANDLIDLLLERFDLEGIYTWLFFHSTQLGGTPLHLLEEGRSRPVFQEARRLVADG
jgi:hypothetical protein